MRVDEFKKYNKMKKNLILFLIIACIAVSNCSSGSGKSSGNIAANTTGKSEIVFREYEHNFGKVSEGEKISYVFTFDNKGTSDLVISSATTTCGCTVPKYDSKPIAPGGSGSLEVVFNTSGRSGMQTKTITVKSNAKIPVVLLKITAEVISK
jgi:hypothetical protein